MSTINQFFDSHPQETGYRVSKRNRIIDIFSEWVDEGSFKDWHLLLYPFTNEPLCFFNSNTVNDLLSFLLSHPYLAWEAITIMAPSLNHAISSALMPTPSWNKQDSLSLDSPDHAAEFESIWHPEYQRYSEHVFNHLIKVPLYILGKLYHKDYITPPLSNRVNVLGSNIGTSITLGFDSIVRNSIAHGSADFEIMAIRYRDAESTKTLSSFEFGDLFDELVDTSHGVLIAILLFIAEYLEKPNAPNSSTLPFGVRYLLTIGYASHPSLTIVTMLETHSIGTGFQLNIVCKVKNPSRGAHQYEGLYISWVSAKLFPSYNRYLIEIDSGQPAHSMLAINGNVLSEAIVNSQELTECAKDLIQGALLWYDAPHWKSSLSTFRNIFSARFPELQTQIRAGFEKAGYISPIYKYKIVSIENNSTQSVPRILCYVLLNLKEALSDVVLLSTLKQIIRRLMRVKVKCLGIYGPKGLSRRPSHITVRLSRNQVRLRALKSQSWQSNDLILIAEWSREKRKLFPFYTKNADYIEGSLRVKYNPNLTLRKP
ncbi:MAG: hypothetical protein C3F13_16325 [Anaerolineales bacterium]|nr:MAG: hypothetical protein C3F13_16325 [Anaerolineales bacterium]